MNHATATRARVHPETRLGASPAAPWATYGDLWRDVDAARAALRARGVGVGDRVVLRTTSLAAFAPLHLATLTEGAVSVPASAHATAAELAALASEVRARAVLDAPPAPPWPSTSSGSPPPAYEASADDLAMLIPTSGTTGRPKAVRVRHGQLTAGVDTLHVAWGWRADDTLLHALPLHHVHGLVVALHGALWAGARVMRHERFDAEAVAAALRGGEVTVFMGVPTMHRRLLATGSLGPLPAVRLITSGSAPLTADDHAAFQAATGVSILERYGMTEALIVLSNPLVGPRIPGSVGTPLPGVELRVVNPDGVEVPRGQEGVLRLRGPSVSDGYEARPDATARAWRDGWLDTGDVGYVREDGYVVLVGRRGDMVITGGYNVHPAEVEAALTTAPGVAEVGVVGLPDPDLGERLVAAVVVGPAWDGEAPVRDVLDRALSRYKHPRAIHIVPALPRNAMGKLDRRALRAQLQEATP